MKRNLSALAAISAALLLAGCAVAPPQMPARRDPFAGLGLDQAQGGRPELSVALIASENTQATVDFGHKALAGSATDKWLKQEFELFQRNFKEVVHVGSMAEARAANVDLIAVLDVYDQTRTACKYDETVVFLAPGGAEVERIRAATDIPFRGPFSINAVLKECVADVQNQVQQGIRRSQTLRDLAARKAGRTPAAAPAAAAPGLPDILRPPRSNRKQDEALYAVVVGIERYSRLPQADFAERDAEAVTEQLLALGVPRRNLIHLSGSEASYSSMKKYLESWLPKNVQPGSRVFFYFSGHGAPDVETGEAYILPWDGDAAFLKDTAYPTKRLYEQLAALPAKEVVVATDACFSGAGGRSVLAKGARPLVLKVDTGTIPRKLTVFAAASGEQITGTLADRGHGMFTYFFLKGLGGAAKDASGAVTAKGLYDYLKPKVQDEARRQNRDQAPVLFSQDDPDLFRF